MACAARDCQKEATDVLEVYIRPEDLPEGGESIDRTVEYCPTHAGVAMQNCANTLYAGERPPFVWLRKVGDDAG